MDISIVVPTLNGARFLPATLSALLRQTVTPAEIIVVDDGSTDDTAAVLASFAPRIQSLRAKNCGALMTRTIGLRAAKSEFVAFCDSHDLWRPDFLASMSALWRAEPRIRAAYGNFTIIRDNEWQNQSKFAAAPAGFWDGLRRLTPELAVFDHPIMNRLLRFQPFLTGTMVARRQFFIDVGGWDETISDSAGCDFATTLRVASHAPIGIVLKPVIGIRAHSESFSYNAQSVDAGEALAPEDARAFRPNHAAHLDPIRQNVTRRRQAALAAAFSRRDFASVQAIYSLLPTAACTGSVALKRKIASLPGPLGQLAAEVMLGVDFVKSSLLKEFSAGESGLGQPTLR